jgi:uncharacterized protein (DUF2141 family)
VDFYANATLIGSDTSTPFGTTWTNVAAGSYSLTAVATDNGGGSATSAPVSLTVIGSTNQPPTVTLTSPASGSSITAPATISLTATASDPDGTVSKVDFFQGSTLIGSDTTSPYSVTWNSVPAGSYTLTAVATDNGGATRTSTSVPITVNASNQLPGVFITAPANGATFVAPATIGITAR